MKWNHDNGIIGCVVGGIVGGVITGTPQGVGRGIIAGHMVGSAAGFAGIDFISEAKLRYLNIKGNQKSITSNEKTDDK
ncbi:MAG: hypothetical protein FWE45_03005 [Firmicutes bacterium]|nr:hypothetical protein [Bacillota bacterium]